MNLIREDLEYTQKVATKQWNFSSNELDLNPFPLNESKKDRNENKYYILSRFLHIYFKMPKFIVFFEFDQIILTHVIYLELILSYFITFHMTFNIAYKDYKNYTQLLCFIPRSNEKKLKVQIYKMNTDIYLNTTNKNKQKRICWQKGLLN